MKLHVTNDINADDTIDTVCINETQFNDIATHPYIASKNFDVIIIDTDLSLNLEYIKVMCGYVRVIPKIVEGNTQKQVLILSAIYPNLAAELRVLSIRDINKYNEVIHDLEAKNEWDLYY